MEPIPANVLFTYEIKYLYISSSKIILKTNNITAKWDKGLIGVITNGTLSYIGFAESAGAALALIAAFLYKEFHRNEIMDILDTLTRNGFNNIKEILYPDGLLLTAERKRHRERLRYACKTKDYELVISTAPRYITVTIRIRFSSGSQSFQCLRKDLDRLLNQSS